MMASAFHTSESRKEVCVKPTNEHIPDTEQEIYREESDSVERKRLQVARASGQVKDPNHHTAQAEVDRPAVHNDPIMALLNDIALSLKLKTWEAF